MKRLINFVGGRPGTNSDFESLQASIDTLESFYSVIGPFVISGCLVTPNSQNPSNIDMTAGVVMINGKAISVDALTNIPSNYYLIDDAFDPINVLPFFKAVGSFATQKRDKVRAIPNFSLSSLASGEALAINPSGMRNFKEAMTQATTRIGQVVFVDQESVVQSNFDLSTGLGFGAWRGWIIPTLSGAYSAPRQRLLFVGDPSTSIPVGALGSEGFTNDSGNLTDQLLTYSVLPARFVGTAPGSPVSLYYVSQ